MLNKLIKSAIKVLLLFCIFILNTNLSIVLVSKPLSSGLIYSSYLHTSNYAHGNTNLKGLCLDSKGNPIYFGYTQDTNYPTTNGVLQEKFQKAKSGISYNDFVTKLNKENFQIEISSFLGLSNLGWNNITIDKEDNIIVVFENTKDTSIQDANYFNTHKRMLIKKISSDFTKVLSTAYFGNDITKSNNNIEVTDMIVDNDNNLIIVSSCDSNGVLTSSNSYMPNLHQGASRIGFITKFSPNLDSIIFSTYHSGTVNAVDVNEKSKCGINKVAVGLDNSIYVSGYTYFNEGNNPSDKFLNTTMLNKDIGKGFISKISADGKTLISNLFNVTDESWISILNHSLMIGIDGGVYVAGNVRNNSIQTVKPCFQCEFDDNWIKAIYIQKYNGNLSSLSNSTLFCNDKCYIQITGLSIDQDGNAYISGLFEEHEILPDSDTVVKLNLPITTKGAFPFDWGPEPNIAPYEEKYAGFVTMLDKNFAKLEFSTTFGGSANIHINFMEVAENNYLYLSGWSYGNKLFPLTENALFKDYYTYHSFLSVFSNFKDQVSVDGFKIAPSNIFPNPANEYLNISFESTKEGTGKIEIIDLLGKTVCSFENYITSGNNSIKYSELSTLPTATYTIKVTMNNEIVSIGKFIKQ